MAYRPLLMIVQAISVIYFLTLADGQLTVDGVKVDLETISGEIPCEITLSRPYLSCDGGKTPDADSTTTIAVSSFYAITRDSLGRDATPIDTAQCAVFMRLPEPDCKEHFPQASGFIRGNISSVGTAGINGVIVAHYASGPFRLQEDPNNGGSR